MHSARSKQVKLHEKHRNGPKRKAMKPSCSGRCISVCILWVDDITLLRPLEVMKCPRKIEKKNSGKVSETVLNSQLNRHSTNDAGPSVKRKE